MTDSTDEYLHNLEVTAGLREPVVRKAIEAAALRMGSCGLDVGCGIGGGTLLLAEAVGEDGEVTGLDISAEFVSRARLNAERAGLADRLSFRTGSADNLPFDDSTLDWAWSVDCVGYGTSDTAALIREMVRVVRPGGMIAILAWASQRLLPGYPRLEARLDATPAGLAPFEASVSEGQHFSMGLGWLRAAGLNALRAEAFAGSVHAPLDESDRAALTALIEMRWPGMERELDGADRHEFSRICDAKSPDYILEHPDYYAFFTYTLLSGTVSD